MQVTEILKTKGGTVVTTSPETTIDNVARILRDMRIGVVIVIGVAGRIAGIISERDIARAVAIHGATLPAMRVADLMTSSVVTCSPENSINEIMTTMTAHRFRHMPVVKDGALVGVISIGDVVKYRLGELETEASVLHEYIRA
ncbi:MAG: CBS domain-containing protein [Rhodospirillales bacterium]|nr:CBS domain-containing protein [Rhodospirillales bacterium]